MERVTAPWHSQCSSKKHTLRKRNKVRAAWAGESVRRPEGLKNPSRKQDSFVCRDGERHPDLLKGGDLRGSLLERGSWLVRMQVGVSPSTSRRTDDNGCPKDAEEGNVVSMRHKAHALDFRTRDRCGWSEDASFARSFDPCTLILTMHVRWKPDVVGRSEWHHGWESSGNREEPTLGLNRTNVARLATHHRPSNGEGVMSKKRKGRRSRPSSLRGSWELRLGCPHVEVKLQKSLGDNWSQISSANALQKERQGWVNRDLARSKSWRVKPSAGTSSERKSRVDLTGKTGENRRRLRVARECHSAV